MRRLVQPIAASLLFLGFCIERGADHPDGIASQQQQVRRVGGSDGLDDELCASRRVAALMAVSRFVLYAAAPGGLGASATCVRSVTSDARASAVSG